MARKRERVAPALGVKRREAREAQRAKVLAAIETAQLEYKAQFKYIELYKPISVYRLFRLHLLAQLKMSYSQIIGYTK
jgi:hypothetical protein